MLAPFILTAVTAERLAELALARRNTRALEARGAREAAPAHYPVIVIVHAAWLASLWIWGWSAIAPGWLGAFLALQPLRIWVLATLGRRWTTRIIILPGAPLVSSGPYRILPHPNYVVVIGEIASLPLALGLPAVAAVFTALNLLILSVRIRAEDEALSKVRGADRRSGRAPTQADPAGVHVSSRTAHACGALLRLIVQSATSGCG